MSLVRHVFLSLADPPRLGHPATAERINDCIKRMPPQLKSLRLRSLQLYYSEPDYLELAEALRRFTLLETQDFLFFGDSIPLQKFRPVASLSSK